MSKRSERGGGGPRGPLGPEELNAVFSALAHPVRRRILVSLSARGGAMQAGEIADRFKHSWPTTTRHLQVLLDAHCVTVTKEGRSRLYRLDSAVLRNAHRWLGEWVDAPVWTDDRPAWTEEPYARMRNAIPPKSDPEPQEDDA